MVQSASGIFGNPRRYINNGDVYIYSRYQHWQVSVCPSMHSGEFQHFSHYGGSHWKGGQSWRQSLKSRVKISKLSFFRIWKTKHFFLSVYVINAPFYVEHIPHVPTDAVNVKCTIYEKPYHYILTKCVF